MTPLFDLPKLLPIDRVVRSSLNPRKRFKESALQEIATSIKRHGVLQPILTRPTMINDVEHYEIVAGERRWRGTRIAELPEIPSIVREMTDSEAIELAVIENAQREDLHPLEEAEGFEALLRAYGQEATAANAEELAGKIGKSRTHIYNRLKLLDLVPDLRDAFFEEEFNATVAQQLARLPSKLQPKALAKLRKATVEGEPINVKASAELLRKEFHLRLDKATFPTDDATLVPAAGSCLKCPRMSGNEPDLFGDEPDNVCTDGSCFQGKLVAFNERIKDKAREAGLAVIEGDEARCLLKFGTASDELNGDYVYMDRPLPDLTGTDKTLARLLGKLLTASALFEHPTSQTLREIVQVTKAIASLREHGLLINDPAKDKPKAKKPKVDPNLGTSVATPRDDSHMQPSAGQAMKEGSAEWPFDVDQDVRSAPVSDLARTRSWRIEAFKALHHEYMDQGYVNDPQRSQAMAVVALAVPVFADDELRQLLVDLWGLDWNSALSIVDNLAAIANQMNGGQLHMLIAEIIGLHELLQPLSDDAEALQAQVLPLLCEDEAVEWQQFMPAQNAIYPTFMPPPAGEVQGAASHEGDKSPSEDKGQAPQGAQSQEDEEQLSGFASQRVTKDGAFWQDQFVKVKKGERKGKVGVVWNIQPGGDVWVCFDKDTFCNDKELFSPKELTALPDQINPHTAAEA